MTITHADKAPEREGSFTERGVTGLSDAKLRPEVLKVLKKCVAHFGVLYKNLAK